MEARHEPHADHTGSPISNSALSHNEPCTSLRKVSPSGVNLNRPMASRCDFFGTCPTTEPADGSYSVTGGIIGGTLGYNWQRGPWVFGVEGDYSWADVSGSSQTCGATSPVPHACGTKLESFGTLRGRIGYAHRRDRQLVTLRDWRTCSR